MANEKRSRGNFAAGALDAALAAGATSMSSPALADLQVIDATNHAAIALFTEDANGRITKKEIVYVTAHTAGATTATIARGKEGTSDQAWSSGDKWEHTSTAKDFDALLAQTSYRPAANTTIGITNTTAAMQDVDAANLVVVFTAPPSGKVNVVLEALTDGPASQSISWGLRDGASAVADSLQYVMFGNATTIRQRICIPLAGLTPGTQYTWKWGAKVTAGTGNIYCGNNGGGVSPYGTALMQVFAVHV